MVHLCSVVGLKVRVCRPPSTQLTFPAFSPSYFFCCCFATLLRAILFPDRRHLSDICCDVCTPKQGNYRSTIERDRQENPIVHLCRFTFGFVFSLPRSTQLAVHPFKEGQCTLYGIDRSVDLTLCGK